MINEKIIGETVSNVIKAVDGIAVNMKGGERFTTAEFVGKVVDETNVPVVIATGLTSLCVKNCDYLFQRSGRNGGIFKKSINKEIAPL